MTFAHQKFIAYQLASSFVGQVQPILRKTASQNRDLADQLKRSSVSVALNIAEGCGRPPGADRRRFYLIARGSATECAASIELCYLIGVISKDTCETHLKTLSRICAILTTVCFTKNTAA